MQSGTDFTDRQTDFAERSVASVFNTGMAWLDLMMQFQRQMQRASFYSLSSYSPAADTRITGRVQQSTEGVRVVPVGEERLNIATRTVPGETTRVRRRVVEQPVEQQVTLREEKVVVERRPATGAEVKGNVLTETVVEMSDSRQVPTVWKSLHVAEEVVLRKQVTERTEKVRETVRRDVVDVEHDRDTTTAFQPPRPAVASPAPRTASLTEAVHAASASAEAHRAAESARHEEHEHRRAEDRRGADEAADKKPAAPQVAARKN